MARRIRGHLGQKVTQRHGDTETKRINGNKKAVLLIFVYLTSVLLWLTRITKFRNDMRAPSVNYLCDCEHSYIQTGARVSRQHSSSDLCLTFYLLTSPLIEDLNF